MTRPARSASTPSHSAAGDACTPAAHMIVRASMRSSPSVTPAPSQSRDAGAEAHLDAELFERTARLLRQRRIERREQARGGLDQDDARRARIDGTEVGGQRPLAPARR